MKNIDVILVLHRWSQANTGRSRQLWSWTCGCWFSVFSNWRESQCFGKSRPAYRYVHIVLSELTQISIMKICTPPNAYIWHS